MIAQLVLNLSEIKKNFITNTMCSNLWDLNLTKFSRSFDCQSHCLPKWSHIAWKYLRPTPPHSLLVKAKYLFNKLFSPARLLYLLLALASDNVTQLIKTPQTSVARKPKCVARMIRLLVEINIHRMGDLSFARVVKLILVCFLCYCEHVPRTRRL